MKLNTARIAICASLLIGTGLSSVIAMAQTTDSEAEYAALLKQISDTKLVIAQKEAYLGSQQSQIDSLKTQIETIPAVKESVRPIVTAMAAEIEKEIINDVPFLAQERFARLDKLKEDLANTAVGESVIYRQAINIYDIETNYGNSVGSYTGENPLNAGGRLSACQENLSTTACAFTDDLKKAVLSNANESLSKRGVTGFFSGVEDDLNARIGAVLQDSTLRDELVGEDGFLAALAKNGDLNDGNYVHFGRLALLYLEIDSSEGYRYDKDNKAWVELSQGEILGVRRSVRIARGESAAGVLTAPIAIDPAP